MKSITVNPISFWAAVLTVGFVLGLSIQFVQAWTTPPSGGPVSGDVAGPLTTGNGQIKAGPLTVNSAFTLDTNSDDVPDAYSQYGLLVPQGNVGIGNSTPAAKLVVGGDVRASKYCNSDGSKCLEYDTYRGSPLYLNSARWTDYTTYNTAISSTIDAWPYLDAAGKAWWKDICIPTGGNWNYTAQDSDPTNFAYCGNFACKSKFSIRPNLTTLKDKCSLGDTACSGGTFVAEWNCMYQ